MAEVEIVLAIFPIVTLRKESEMPFVQFMLMYM